MDLMPAKTKPISDGGSASGIMYLRREKQLCTTAAKEQEHVRETIPQTAESVKTGMGDSLLACSEDHGEENCVAAAHGSPQCRR